MNTTYGHFKQLGDHRTNLIDVIECMIGVMGSATNMIVLLAIYKERKLRTITNCFVGSLAASDVLVGLVVPPLVILSNELLPINFKVCVFLNSLVVLLTNISLLNLLSVALERFVAIRNPFMYCRWMSTTRALYLVAATWLLAIFIGLVPLMGWHSEEEGYTKCSFHRVISLEYLVYCIFFVVTLPPLVAMIFIYVYIFTVVRRVKRQTEKMSRGLDHIKKTIKRNSRGDLSILLVIVLFMLCWMPLHITNSILLYFDLHVPRELYAMFNTLSRFNCLVNPFLFAFGYSHFKVAIKRILCKRCINIEDEVSSDRPELHYIKNSNIKHAHYMQYPFTFSDPIQDFNDLAAQSSERSGKIQQLSEDVITKKAKVSDILQLPHQSEMSDQEASQRDTEWQEFNKLMFSQSVIEDNSYVFSVVDIISDDLVCEVGEFKSELSAKIRIGDVGEKSEEKTQSSAFSITKTENILDELFKSSNFEFESSTETHVKESVE